MKNNPADFANLSVVAGPRAKDQIGATEEGPVVQSSLGVIVEAPTNQTESQEITTRSDKAQDGG
jgi:hypothetical protein